MFVVVNVSCFFLCVAIFKPLLLPLFPHRQLSVFSSIQTQSQLWMKKLGVCFWRTILSTSPVHVCSQRSMPWVGLVGPLGYLRTLMMAHSQRNMQVTPQRERDLVQQLCQLLWVMEPVPPSATAVVALVISQWKRKQTKSEHWGDFNTSARIECVYEWVCV